MITLIHGEDTKSSRQYLISRKEKAKQTVSFDGQSVSLTQLMQVEGGDMFSKPNVASVFIEDFFSKRKQGKEVDDIVEFLNRGLVDAFLWEGREITKKQLGKVNIGENKLFSFPQVLFLFLDAIGKDHRKSLSLFHQALEYVEEELIFFMMVRQCRLLLSLEEVSGTIEERKRLAPWQVQKLKKQKAAFTNEELISLYQKLFTIDYTMKTSNSPLTLSQSIDFFLIGI